MTAAAIHTQERDGDRHHVETADGRERYQLRVVETGRGYGIRQTLHSGHGARSTLRHSRMICRDMAEAAARRCAQREASAIRRWLDQQ